MAEIVYHKKHKDYYEFRLSNKPDFLFLCDLEDFNILFAGGWYVHVSTKTKNARPYIRKTLHNGKHTHFHRVVMSAGDFNMESVVDHINRNTLDCRKPNLRIVTNTENLQNRNNFYSGKTEVVEYNGLKLHLTKVRKKRKGVYVLETHQVYDGKKYVTSKKDINIAREDAIKYLKEKYNEQKNNPGNES